MSTVRINYITEGLRQLCVAVALFCILPLAAQVNTDQVMRIGQNALYFEDYMLSIQYFNQAIAAKPYLAQPYFLRAIAKLNLEDYDGAEADASKAVELNPFLTDAWEVRGVARQNLGKNRDAIDDYSQALKLLPRNRQLLFNKALALSDIKEYDLARETFDQLVRYYPAYDNAYLGRARMNLVAADTAAALNDIEKALSLNRNALNAYIMRADIAINSDGDFERALADIDEAIRLQPHAAGLYINRAFIRYRLDSYNGAMADYDYALSLDPLNSVALFNRGLL
ncbi:MAG: tetratricopeptide repeat protein, partial [Muribaculaceae bacterium]|nr:tetratricopeptide repeat protein [Muribaculaceae bacterium]